MRAEVFGKVAPSKPDPNEKPKGPRRFNAPISEREEDEFIERPPPTLPVAPVLDPGLLQKKSKPFSFAAPQPRVRRVDAAGWATGIGGRKTAASRVRVRLGTGTV